jgi:prepilin-type N-terminal cleavage/methylation domain-containing protein
MNTVRSANQRRRTAARAAFTLVELVVAMAVIGVVVVSLYGGITSGISSVRMARENLRATQILVEKTEAIRLYRWDQITNSLFRHRFGCGRAFECLLFERHAPGNRASNLDNGPPGTQAPSQHLCLPHWIAKLCLLAAAPALASR